MTLEGARSLTGTRVSPRAFLPAPLPPRELGPLELTDLVRFVEHPVRAFLRQRLGISVGDYSDEVSDALPVELDALEKWGVGQRLLDAVMAGTDGRTAIRAEIAAGKLPPGQLGYPVVQSIWQGVDEIAGQARALISGEAGSVDVKVDVAGRRLTGTVPGVRGDAADDDHVLEGQPAAPARRVGAAARALRRGRSSYSAATIGRASGAHGRVTVARVPAVSREDALAALEVLIELYDRGMREPLPLACRTSAAFAAGANPRGEWESDRFPKEDRDAEHELVYGPGTRSPPCWRPHRATTSAGTRSSGRASGSTRCACGTGCWRWRRWARHEPRVRYLRRAAAWHHRARGERGHRQDVHDRGAGGALRGRGHAPGPAPAGDVHAHGDGRAARPRARAAGLG